MVILGIDPALVNLGWGVISFINSQLCYIDSGTIKNNNANEPMPLRLANIALELEKIILKYNPTAVVMEETFINKNAVSSLKLGFARGAIMALIGKHNINYIEYKPNLIKKTVVGNGHAEKAQILHMIKLIIPGAGKVDDFDQADALAAAYTFVAFHKFHTLNKIIY